VYHLQLPTNYDIQYVFVHIIIMLYHIDQTHNTHHAARGVDKSFFYYYYYYYHIYILFFLYYFNCFAVTPVRDVSVPHTSTYNILTTYINYDIIIIIIMRNTYYALPPRGVYNLTRINMSCCTRSYWCGFYKTHTNIIATNCRYVVFVYCMYTYNITLWSYSRIGIGLWRGRMLFTFVT